MKYWPSNLNIKLTITSRSIAFVFFFNRLFASFVTYGIRAYTWHYYRVHISIQALQISLLAGRVFFKSVRYHGKNESILVQEGYITWQYWLRHVQEVDLLTSHNACQPASPKADVLTKEDIKDAGKEETQAASQAADQEEAITERKVKELPCRVLVKAKGVEWFIYNRSPAYDTILQSMRNGDESHRARSSSIFDRERKGSSDSYRDSFYKDQTQPRTGIKEGKDGDSKGLFEDGSLGPSSSNSSAKPPNAQQDALPRLLNLLPIGVECKKGAIVMGNRNTHSIFTAKIDSAAGKINARAPRAYLDRYKQTFELEFQHPVIEFKHNRNYVESHIIEGEKLHSRSEQGPRPNGRWYDLLEHRNRAHRAWTSLCEFARYRRGSVESFTHPHPSSAGAHDLTYDTTAAYGQNRWLGLTRYLDDDDDHLEQERWKGVEYGHFATIVDSPSITMNFYWDVPGLVPDSPAGSKSPMPGSETNINGDAPPDWGIDLRVGGGTINYGPWADRQRAELQAVFFPINYTDASPTAILAPGQVRISTAMKIVLEIESQTTLRVPTREESKDWRWRGHKVSSTVNGGKEKKPKQHGKIHRGKKKPSQYPEVRPPGWLDVKVLPDSAVSFTLDLVAGSDGYKNRVELDLKGLEISSSVNHGLLWRSKSQTIICDLSNPLTWNALHRWNIEIYDSGIELFILRDHIFLLTDLVSDWTSGPPGDFHTFVPFEYSIGLNMSDFKLYLNANDSNIINNPSNIDDNTFIVVWGDVLKAGLTIPSNVFRPARSQVSFNVEASEGGFELRTPPQNTQHTFLESSDVASLKDLTIHGSYNYFTSTSPSLTDILQMSVYGLSPRVDLHGFLIRYVLKIKDNYFGDDTHFRTLEEYQSQMTQATENPILGDGLSVQHSRLSNDLDVILSVRAERCCALLPAHLYSTSENTRLEILLMTADLRITNYYMDLALTSSPIAISYLSHSKHKGHDPGAYSNTQVFIDGLELFGHRLFGLPPTEPTYICNWDFDVGSVKGECSIDFLRCFAMSLRCFGLTFDDAENALPPLNPPVIHDATFLRARIKSISIGVRVEQAAFLVQTGLIDVDFNDWSGAFFSERVHIRVPDLTLAVTDGRGALMDRNIAQDRAKTHAYIRATVELNVVTRKHDFQTDRHLQQSHIMLHDTRTRRAPWLVHHPEQLGPSGASSRPTKVRPPAMPFPTMPEPLLAFTHQASDGASLISSSTDSGSSRTTTSRRSTFLLNGPPKIVEAHNPGNIIDFRTQREQGFGLGKARGAERRKGSQSPYGGETLLSIDRDTIDEDIDERAAFKGDFARSGLSFSSPYKEPHFPLLAIQPDITNVPSLPEHLALDSLMTDAGALGNIASPISSQDTSQSSLMVNFNNGVQVFCSPEALFLVTQILFGFQTNHAATVLDGLQIDTMTGVVKAEGRRRKESQTSDVRVFVPWVAISFVHTSNSSTSSTTRQERYDVTLDHLTATAMSSKRLSTSSGVNDSSQYSFHVVLDRLECSARESVGGNADDQALIGLTVNNLILWTWHRATTSADLQFRKVEILSASRKVDYISSLIRQTLIVFEDLSCRFAKLEKERTSRVRLLVLLLMIEGNGVPDPPFLTRASYILRSSSRHLRTSDSWKIMSRLRYIYQSLSALSRDKIHAQCIHKLASCPQDAGTRVIASFKDSGIWNIAHVRSSLLMQRVYGEMLNPSTPRREVTGLFKASVRAGDIQVLVEPGTTQNEIAVKGLVIGLSLNQTSPSNDSSSSDLSGMSRSTIQVHCVEIAVRLNWTLLGLLENVVQTLQASAGPRHRRPTEYSESQASLARQHLHIVISTEMSILSCETPNLKIISLCQGLRTSIVALEDSNISSSSTTSILFHADGATSEIKSHSELLTLYKLRRPKVFGNKKSIVNRAAEEPWQLAGTGEDVLFQVLANPLQLIEAADNFLQYEVAHLLEWAKSLKIAPGAVESSSPGTQKQTRLSRVQVALFLDTYLISLGVLPSLTYRISGIGAGTSIKSGLHGDHDLAVNFTLQNHTHVFKAKGNREDALDVLSTLQMPPINGRVSLGLAPSQKSVDCHVLLESIVLNASAVHAIYTAVNRPEIGSLGKSISHEISLFREHFKDIFDIEESDEISQPSNPILYKANIAMASLAVQARTSDAWSNAQGAELQFKMARTQMKVTNQDEGAVAAMESPELVVLLRGVDLQLLRYENLNLLPCGNVAVEAILRSTSESNITGELVRSYKVRSSSLQINIYAETAPVVVAIIGHLHDTLKTVDFSQEVQNLRKLGRARPQYEARETRLDNNHPAQPETGKATLLSSMCSLELLNICVIWRIESSTHIVSGREPENLILSFTKIDLATERDTAARLLIENFQVQMVPMSKTSTARSSNSALLPEMVFNVAYVSTTQDRRLAFQAAGKSLDLQLTSQFILPASDLRRSIAFSIERVRTATADWKASATVTDGQTKRLLGNKRLSSLLIDADFAGAVVHMQGRSVADPQSLALNVLRGGRLPQHGRYNQFTPENASNSNTTLRAPGIALKVEYKNAGIDEQSLNAEMKVHASSNILYPTVVPLVMEITASVKDIVGEPSEQDRSTRRSNLSQPKFLEDERLRGADPSAIFGKCRLNLGLRICRQEFSLSCQPIARVAATARFEDIYITVNTVHSHKHGKFFTVSGTFKGLQASIQHVYSRDSTGSFDIESIVVSLMNSKHVSSANGISAILNISPMKAQVNGKQSQDFLLFREIWVPPEIRRSTPASAPVPASESQAFIVQRYQQIAATGAFPWNATVSIAELDVQVDLGQSLGKSAFVITNFWISSRKTSDWEQNLCLGFDTMAVNSTGRMSGFVELQNLKLRTSIQWPVIEKAHNQTPLVQASLAFDHLRVKAAFEYHAFAIADITTFEFLMYNLRDVQNAGRDRLVGVLDGDKMQVFCTTTSSSQAIALYQAFLRLYQEKVAAYELSLRDIEKFLRRKSSINPMVVRIAAKRQEDTGAESLESSLKLQTDVVVTLKAINIGAFPSTFVDNQIFKLEALDATARFAVVLDNDKIHSTLGMTLGQLRVALAGITRASVPKTLGEVMVADVVTAATGSRGGTILKVPKLVATMETWQGPKSTEIEYIFTSSFQGKVDVGWNYSRISYIKGMWTTHARALAQRLGKPLPQSAVQITGGSRPDRDEGSQPQHEGENGKITAVVNVPQSKYQYTALRPPVIETPQLRDMGEATPPLEWIGLHRDKLPNLTHQIVIVSLLEVAKEVDDAYSRILGSS